MGLPHHVLDTRRAPGYSSSTPDTGHLSSAQTQDTCPAPRHRTLVWRPKHRTRIQHPHTVGASHLSRTIRAGRVQQVPPDACPAPPHSRCVKCQSRDNFGGLTTNPSDIGYCDLGTPAEPGGSQCPTGTAPTSKSTTLGGTSTRGTVSPQQRLIRAQHPGGVLPPPHNLSIGKGAPMGVHSVPPDTLLVDSILPRVERCHSLL